MPARRRVLLTGATGLLGPYLARALYNGGYALRATRRPTSDTAALSDLPDVEWVTGELDDVGFLDEALRDVDAVVHAAGLVSYAKDARAALRHVNVDVTAAVADAGLRSGVGHFLHVSSVAAISPARRDGLLDESALTFHEHPDTTSYARSKYAGEREVWRAGEEGLPFTVFNPSIILGVGDWGRSSVQLFPWVARGQRFYPPGGAGYVDARDVAAFAKTCLDAGPAGRRYIVNAENWKFGDFFRAVARALHVDPPCVLAKAWQAEAAWRWALLSAGARGERSVLTRESARRAMLDIAYDNAASVAAGARYRPLRHTVEDVAQQYLLGHEGA